MSQVQIYARQHIRHLRCLLLKAFVVFTMVFSKYPDRYFKFSVITAHTNFPPSEKMGTCYVLVAPAHNCLYTGVLFTAFPQTVAMGLLFFFF